MAAHTHISHWRLQDTTYHYRCPRCREWLACDWSSRQEPRLCGGCGLRHVATSPLFDPKAWVETREPPYEMVRAAFLMHGRIVDGTHVCTTPGCRREAAVLDHHVAFDDFATPEENPGKTCVENLYPVCPECDRSQASRRNEWIRSSSMRLVIEK